MLIVRFTFPLESPSLTSGQPAPFNKGAKTEATTEAKMAAKTEAEMGTKMGTEINAGSYPSCLPCQREGDRVSGGGIHFLSQARRTVHKRYPASLCLRGETMSYKHNPDLTGAARELRKNMTPEERHLWYGFLRTYPVRFLRQKVIDQYIADFYCSKARLVIELDGSQHYDPEGLKRDALRTSHLEKRGLTVLHIPNIEISRNFRAVCELIDDYVNNTLKGQ